MSGAYAYMVGVAAALYLSAYIFAFFNGVVVSYGILLSTGLAKKKEAPRRFTWWPVYVGLLIALNWLFLWAWHFYVMDGGGIPRFFIPLIWAALYSGYLMGRWSSYGPLRWALMRLMSALYRFTHYKEKAI